MAPRKHGSRSAPAASRVRCQFPGGGEMIGRLSVGLAALAMLTASDAIAQTADTARYAVAYVEVTPVGVPGATKAFHTYRQTAMGETGFVAFDLFEQLGRAGHFVLVETWRDQASFDAHQTAASQS